MPPPRPPQDSSVARIHSSALKPESTRSFGTDANAIAIGADLGYQWVWDSGFVLDIGLGPNYYIGLGDSVVGDFDGILPRFILAVGYAW